MKKLLSFVEWRRKNFEYESIEEFKKFLFSSGIDGLELTRCNEESFIPKDLILGVHLPFFTSWLDYYKGNTDRVVEEFGSSDIAKNFYTYPRKELYKYFLESLNFANDIGAYTVFHVANTTGLEYLNQKHFYSDFDVVDASIDLINELLGHSDFRGDFLLENLYFPGLKFTDRRLTERLLEKIKYKKVGFVLDTGHLMCTNTEIKNEDEAWDYVERIVDYNRDLLPYFKAVHLHASVSGEVIEYYKKNPPKMKAEFYERFAQVYDYVNLIDTHSIAKSKKCRKVIEKIDPDFLVLEFKYENRRDMESKLKKQLAIL